MNDSGAENTKANSNGLEPQGTFKPGNSTETISNDTLISTETISNGTSDISKSNLYPVAATC